MMEKYSDIINTQWPPVSKRNQMSLNQRAKIFLPFSALKGYEESLENERQITVRKTNLSEDRKMQINETIAKIVARLESKENVSGSATYFIPSPDSNEGVYEEICGTIKKVDTENGFLKIAGQEINFDDISELRIE